MLSYTAQLNQRIIYSLGDTHGRGYEQLEFINKIRKNNNELDKNSVAFVQLGDLCDSFSFPADDSLDSLCREIDILSHRHAPLKSVLSSDQPLVNWHKHETDREGDIVGLFSAHALLERRRRDEIVALYEACKSYETLALYSDFQQSHPSEFYVILGNHDVDLLLGGAHYGRQQKYLLFGLLGFSPSEVETHMKSGIADLWKRHAYLQWLHERPHLALSADAIYMHGGPTGALSNRLNLGGDTAFAQWLSELDDARQKGLNHPEFEEHRSFLSPDGLENDWLLHPERIVAFLKAANRSYAAVGHSPFLDFNKGIKIALDTTCYNALFETPAQLPPNGMLIKHDTNLKRGGQLWACRHQIGSSLWEGIDINLNRHPLRTRGNIPE